MIDKSNTDNKSSNRNLRRFVLSFILFLCLLVSYVVKRNEEIKTKLTPAATQEKFIKEATNLYANFAKMKKDHFDFTNPYPKHVFTKKFAKYFDTQTTCNDFYKDPCLWNNYTYKTLDGEIKPYFFGRPDIGQFITKNGALYTIYSDKNNGLSLFIDINGIKGKPNRFGIDLFGFYIDTNFTELRCMGETETPYVSINLYCNPYNSNKYNGLSCTYKAALENDYFYEVFKLLK